MKSVLLFILAVALLQVSLVAEETVTLISDAAATNTLTLAEGDSAKLKFAHATSSPAGVTAYNCYLEVKTKGKTLTIPGHTGTVSGAAPVAPVEISGPATILLMTSQ